MSEINWLDMTMPSHKCTICGALWRFWRADDFPSIKDDSWTLCSNTCGQCCDNVAMEKQIVPMTRKDALSWLQAYLAVEAMKVSLSAPAPSGH